MFLSIFLFTTLLVPFPGAVAKTAVPFKSLQDGEFIVELTPDTILLIDRNGRIVDEYFTQPYDIRDGSIIPGEKVMVIILGKKGESRGERVGCFSFSDGKITRQWIDTDRGYHPWKIMSTDVDGDTKPDVCLGVWKKTQFHSVYDNRLFVFSWENGTIYPKWLGSRLSSPFVDFDFRDLDQDGFPELIALEYQKNGLKRVMSYQWSGFGFTGYSILEKDLSINNLDHFNQGNNSLPRTLKKDKKEK